MSTGRFLLIHTQYPCDLRNFQRGRTEPVRFLVIHYVGAEGGAEANCLYYGRETVGASAHFFVGHAPFAEVWRSVAEGDTAWHCGTTKGYKHPECRNANSIGVELCCHQDKAGKWYFDSETLDSAVELCRDIMERYGIDSAHVVRHYDVTGKICPAPFVEDGAAWTAFKKRLEEVNMTKEEIEELVDQRVGQGIAAYEDNVAAALDRPVSPYAAQAWEKAKAKGILDGSRPNGSLTREQYAVTLDRRGELD